MVEKVLRPLSTKFGVVVTTIEESKDLDSLTIDEFMGSLLSHEARINKNKDSTLEIAFKVRFLFQETKVEAEVEREAEDEAEGMVVRKMTEKSMNMQVEATTKASTIIKELTKQR